MQAKNQMEAFDEILFDIYVTVEIYFNETPKRFEEIKNTNLTRVHSLYTLLDIKPKEQQIKLYEEFKRHTDFVEKRYYVLSALYCLENINYQTLRVLEQTFSNIIQFWNYRFFGYELDQARFEINTYKAGQRP
jgi:hypothetical protein